MMVDLCMTLNMTLALKTFVRLVLLKCFFQFEALEAVHAEEPFLLMTDIRCTSPWPVDIKTSTVALVGGELLALLLPLFV